MMTFVYCRDNEGFEDAVCIFEGGQVRRLLVPNEAGQMVGMVVSATFRTQLPAISVAKTKGSPLSTGRSGRGLLELRLPLAK